MLWEEGSVKVNHPRVVWGHAGDDETLVHCRLDQLKGSDPALNAQRATYTSAYDRAKKHLDFEIAFEIIERCANEETVDLLADRVFYSDLPIEIIYPHPSFDDEDGSAMGDDPKRGTTNALPVAYARYLAERLGATVNEVVIQSARVGRTHLPRWLRFLCQPTFDGPVATDRSYLIVDDVISTGGTLAALRSYLLRNGATVAGTTAIATKTGLHQKFAIADQTVTMLRSTYGSGLSRYWTGTFGHDIAHLTEAEGQFLLGAVARDWPGTSGDAALQRLRERINQAASKGE